MHFNFYNVFNQKILKQLTQAQDPGVNQLRHQTPPPQQKLESMHWRRKKTLNLWSTRIKLLKHCVLREGSWHYHMYGDIQRVPAMETTGRVQGQWLRSRKSKRTLLSLQWKRQRCSRLSILQNKGHLKKKREIQLIKRSS